MAQSPAEVNDWVTAISNTLPPPPHLPLENKRCSLTPLRDTLPNTHQSQLQSSKLCNNAHECTTTAVSTKKNHDDDHTVLSGVVIDWGHGWGWGEATWAAQSACAHDASISSAFYCHAAEDYGVSGYDEVDWSAFGDFCF
ncbi:hypothetical protein PPYR_01268 [Photinus pyralis]|uniref:PH domain-containing protein n=1 Tax=Photinus pyralis TaxID=7054 RepID=A0A5N4B437_PHOPY|nr:hypothetical protein PPYR_01268 [Photinus pyralis]